MKNWMTKSIRILPRTVAVLGEVTDLAIHAEGKGFFGMRFREGNLLCADPGGSQMFILRPRASHKPVAASSQAIHALDLHERFVHRRGNGFFNAIVPSVKDPKFAGDIVVLRYVVEKEDGQPVEWEHYFEEPGISPAYAQLWDISGGQFWIPPGRWKITSSGIEFRSTTKGENPWLS